MIRQGPAERASQPLFSLFRRRLLNQCWNALNRSSPWPISIVIKGLASHLSFETSARDCESVRVITTFSAGGRPLIPWSRVACRSSQAYLRAIFQLSSAKNNAIRINGHSLLRPEDQKPSHARAHVDAIAIILDQAFDTIGYRRAHTRIVRQRVQDSELPIRSSAFFV